MKVDFKLKETYHIYCRKYQVDTLKKFKLIVYTSKFEFGFSCSTISYIFYFEVKFKRNFSKILTCSLHVDNYDFFFKTLPTKYRKEYDFFFQNYEYKKKL